MNKALNISSTESLGPTPSNLKLIGCSKQDAFICLYDAYVNLVHRYVNFRVANNEVTENITSQVFLKAWEQLPDYQTQKSPIIKWLYSIANNAISDHDHAIQRETRYEQ
jgi:DNA-directed RNA polymerase specialized sigma24 family protein